MPPRSIRRGAMSSSILLGEPPASTTTCTSKPSRTRLSAGWTVHTSLVTPAMISFLRVVGGWELRPRQGLVVSAGRKKWWDPLSPPDYQTIADQILIQGPAALWR